MKTTNSRANTHGMISSMALMSALSANQGFSLAEGGWRTAPSVNKPRSAEMRAAKIEAAQVKRERKMQRNLGVK